MLKKHVLPFLIIVFLFAWAPSSVNAQLSPLLSHKSKVHVNEKNNSIYWPKNLPFFVRLSTSDDPNAPSYLLNELSKKEGNEYVTQEKPSINLDISGSQFLRWVDINTKDTLFFRFVSDGEAPNTSLTLSNAPAYKNSGSIQFYGKGLSISIQAKDAFSGVEQTYVSLDESGYNAYFSMLNFNQEKRVLLDYYSVDFTGNVEAPKRFDFTVDLTTPQSEFSLKGLYQAPVYSPNVMITLSSKDALSGVKLISYQMDAKAKTEYGKPISMEGLDDGEHTLLFWAEDFVKNEEQPNKLSFYLDRTPPKSFIQAETDVYKSGNDTFVSSRTQFSLSATDNKSGVKLIEFSFDEAVKLYESPFRLPGMEGAVTIRYRAMDNMENKASYSQTVYQSDLSAPQSSFSIKGKYYTQRNLYWIRKESELILTAKDNLSGVRKIGYSINKNTSQTEYKKPITFENDGRFDVLYSSIDNVSNQENDNQVSIIVDTEMPQILVNFSTSNIGSQANAKNEVLEVFPLGTSLYLAATDKSSGLASIQYKINDKALSNYTMPIVFDTIGEYTVTIIATDNVDNKITKEIKLIAKD